MLSFHVKFVQTDGLMDGQTDRQTTVKQHVPDLSINGHKKEKNMLVISIVFFFQTVFYLYQSQVPSFEPLLICCLQH